MTSLFLGFPERVGIRSNGVKAAENIKMRGQKKGGTKTVFKKQTVESKHLKTWKVQVITSYLPPHVSSDNRNILLCMKPYNKSKHFEESISDI